MAANTTSPELGDKYNDYNNVYVVQFKTSASYMDIYDCVSKYHFQPLADSSERVFKIQTDDFSLFMSTYNEIIEYAEAIKKRQALMVPNDPLYQEQWAIPNLNLNDAWDITTGASSVLVGVIDTGIFRDHEDFNKSSILSGYDIVRNYAVSKGCIVDAAAGNDGHTHRDKLVYPASYQGVISV